MLSIALQGNKTWTDYQHLGRLAEDLGFDVISVYADLGFQPAIVPLLAIAEVTERILLGPAALNTHLLHPVEIAGQIATLDQLSGGRAYLGLVRGAWLDRLGIEDQAPIARMKESIELIRLLWSGRSGSFTGDHFQVSQLPLLEYPMDRPDIPILIGAWGPHMLALAGELANEVKIGGTANPDLASVIRERLAPGLEASGRPATSVRIAVGAVCVVDENAQAARQLAREEVARYLPVVAALDPTVELPPQLLTELQPLVSCGDWSAAANLIPDHLLDRFAYAGSPDQIIRQVRNLFDAGIDRVEFGTPHGLRDAGEGIRLLGEQVLPAFR